MMNRILAYLTFTIFLTFLPTVVDAQHKTRPNVGNMIIRALDAYQKGDLQVAETILNKIIDIDPENDAAWYYKGLCKTGTDNVDEMEECLVTASRLDPENFWYRYRLATLYSLTSRLELAIDIYEKLLNDFPKKSELYLELAEMYSAAGELEKSLATIDQIETVFGVSESTTIYRYNLLRSMNRLKEAYDSLEEYNKKYSSPYVLSVLAEHHLSQYDDSTALAYYNEALDLASGYTPALLGKAETLRLTMKYDEYFEALKDLVSNQSDTPDSKVRYLKAVFTEVDRKFLNHFQQKMDDVMDLAVNTHPSDTGVLRLATLYCFTTERYDLAKKAAEHNCRQNPDDSYVRHDYLGVLMLFSDWEKLEKESLDAMQRFPDVQEFMSLAAMALRNQKKHVQEIELYDRILNSGQKDDADLVDVWASRGDAYCLLGDYKKAYKSYDMALKIDPDNIYALNNYAYYLSVQGKNLKKAYAMSRKTVEAKPDDATYLDTFGWILYLMGKPEEARSHFKHAMLYGGKESAVILDHYAEVLFALGEYDKAMVYWNSAIRKNNGEIPDLEERVSERKKQMRKAL